MEFNKWVWVFYSTSFQTYNFKLNSLSNLIMRCSDNTIDNNKKITNATDCQEVEFI